MKSIVASMSLCGSTLKQRGWSRSRSATIADLRRMRPGESFPFFSQSEFGNGTRFVLAKLHLEIGYEPKRYPLWASARKWTDQSGNHTVEAELIEIDGEQVVLQKSDNKVLRILRDEPNIAEIFIESHDGSRLLIAPTLKRSTTFESVELTSLEMLRFLNP